VLQDFWASSGYRLLEAKSDGGLAITDDFLRMLVSRPELAPIPESCARELALHDTLIADPKSAIPAAQLLLMRDVDAQENYRIFLRFRDRLLAAPSLQNAYLALFQGSGVDVPPLFVFHLTQLLLRHALGNAAEPLHVRMAECLFRTQKVTVLEDGGVMAADYETIETFSETGGFGHIGELLKKQNLKTRSIDLDVMNADNANEYWKRDERFDFAVSLNRGQPALDALCRVLEKWVAHFLGVSVKITHKREIDDRRWAWHVGLDAVASSILNDLYNNKPVEEERMSRLLCLFELTFDNPAEMRPALAGKPVYLGLAMDEHNLLKIKPQNLLLNLPLARA
jgi:Family of unknown function (DUF6352)